MKQNYNNKQLVEDLFQGQKEGKAPEFANGGEIFDRRLQDIALQVATIKEMLEESTLKKSNPTPEGIIARHGYPKCVVGLR